MRAVFYLLAALAGLALLWLFSLLPRYKHPQMQELRRWRYAHRGLHHAWQGIPENSLLAFRYALAGSFGAELDVRMTRDRQLVVIHDSDLRRLCGVEGKVETMTWEQLRPLRLLNSKERIPLLQEVLPLFEGKAPLIIELKTERKNYRELCERVCRMLEGYRGLFCLDSFDPRALWWLRRNEPFVVRGQLTENFFQREKELKKPLQLLMTSLATNLFTRPDFLACRWEDRGTLPMRICTEMLGVQEFSWTVRSGKKLEEMEAAGAAVIFEGFLPGRDSGAADEDEEAAVPVGEAE